MGEAKQLLEFKHKCETEVANLAGELLKALVFNEGLDFQFVHVERAFQLAVQFVQEKTRRRNSIT